MKSRFGKYCIVLFLSAFTLFSCDSFNKKKTQEIIEIIELDQLPMYGSGPEYGSLQKTPEQLDADKVFLEKSDEVQPSRIQACIDYIEFGWYYLKQGDTENAMRRANQAWQLNSTNPDVYGLFAAILNAREDNAGALQMLDRGINIKPNYINLYDMYLSESVDVYRQTGDASSINKLIQMLDKVVFEEDSLKQKVAKIKEDAQQYLTK